MTNRDWFCLALRLLGIWLLIQAIENIVPYLLFALGANGVGQNFSYLAGMIFWIIGRTAIGFAPAIATRFYPSTQSTESAHVDDEAKPLKIGIQLLAVYALLLAIQSGASVILGLVSDDTWGRAFSTNFDGSGTGYLTNLLTFGLNIAFAAILLIWNERVVTLIAKFRYIPERDAYQPPPLNE